MARTKTEKKRIFPESTFKSIIKELLRKKDVSVSKKAYEILQEASESYLIEIFESKSKTPKLDLLTNLFETIVMSDFCNK